MAVGVVHHVDGAAVRGANPDVQPRVSVPSAGMSQNERASAQPVS
ncbi:MAG: hypothetical protein ACRDY2_12810 [Acidimicrobiales bacterium]